MWSKFFAFLLLMLICSAASGCVFFGSPSGARSSGGSNAAGSNKNAAPRQSSKDYAQHKRLAAIAVDGLNEASGIAASQKNKNVFWTHNDSGDSALLYAFDRAGKKRGVWRVARAKNVDWEDLAAYADRRDGENYLFIGDIGNNGKDRAELTIYRVREPEVTAEDAESSKSDPRETEPAEAIRIRYPNGRRDAETLMVNPETGDLYVLSKNAEGNSDVYKLRAPFDSGKTNQMERVGAVGVPSLAPGFLTGGAISPDGKRLVVCDYFAAYEFVLPAGAENFDEIWKQTPLVIELGERAQGEAVTYRADGLGVVATSEKKNPPLIEVERK